MIININNFRMNKNFNEKIDFKYNHIPEIEKDKINLDIKEKDGIIVNQDNNKIFENI